VAEVRGLALPPAARVGGIYGVRTRLHNRRDIRAELAVDALEHRSPAAILDTVVQQRGDRLGLIAAVFEHQPGHDHEVRGVRDLRAEPMPRARHRTKPDLILREGGVADCGASCPRSATPSSREVPEMAVFGVR
jgi:hypothetical protein